MNTAFSVSVIVIGVFILLKAVLIAVGFVQDLIYLKSLEKEWHQREEKHRKKAAIAKEIEDEFKAKREKRIQEGLIEIPGHYWLFFKKQDGRPVALFDLEGNRLPLCQLALLSESKVVGIDPTIYFRGLKFTPDQLKKDDLEILALAKTIQNAN